ncbi:MAG: phage portal protein [Nitrosopumilaceae archaeon]|nr:phage portal protein [Nitrosopumilaceae archaeon]NIU87798.1 phage portal protein [Nitrosopumilaceae archaeon]NIV65181.1 phage portal protein [Nitrosopumilaceae archaeon]NIX61696.1 phage portal protein [Nitrosopumilaceae archaeon]
MFTSVRAKLAQWIAPKLKQSTSTAAALFGNGAHGFGSFSSRSVPELLDTYNKSPWLRAVVHKVSHSTASTPWRLFFIRDSASGRAIRISKLQVGDSQSRQRVFRNLYRNSKQQGLEIVELEDHPILHLLNEGSYSDTGISATQLVHIYLDLVGEAVQLKERSQRIINDRTEQGIVTNLLTIPPHWIQALPTADHPFFSIRLGGSGFVDDIPREDVIYYKDPDPRNPFGRGSGTAQSLSSELQANEAAATTIWSRLENNSIPPFLAMPDTDTPGMGPSDQQLERIREDWQRRLRGPTKNGFIHFLKAPFKIKQLANTFEELSLIPLLQYQRDTVFQVYGVPPELWGSLQSSNKATITSAERLFTRHVILPRLEFRRNVLQQRLVTEFDDRLILDFESPVPEDKEFEFKVMSSQAWAFTGNEIRERAGLLEKEDANVHAVPTNVFIQSSLGGAAEPPEDQESLKEFSSSSLESFSLRIEKIKQDKDDINEVVNSIDAEDIDNTTAGPFRRGIQTAGQRRLDDLAVGLNFDMQDPVVVDFITEESAIQITGINDETKALIRQTLVDGVENGEDINSLTQRIRRTFDGFSGRRAAMISRTESVRAMNSGQVAATKQAGFEGKQWLSTRDPKVRDSHAVGTGLDGQIVGVDEDFISPTGARGPWPGALDRAEDSVNCRCTTLSIVRRPSENSNEIFWNEEVNTEDKRETVWKAAEEIRLPIEVEFRAGLIDGFEQQKLQAISILRRLFG